MHGQQNVKTFQPVYKNQTLSVYRAKPVVRPEICTKQINALCGQKVEPFNVKAGGT